ncbi:hypothetical protein ACJX0J_026039 [Zea mays]
MEVIVFAFSILGHLLGTFRAYSLAHLLIVIVFAFSLVQENQLILQQKIIETCAKKETYKGVEKNELNKVESYPILLFLENKIPLDPTFLFELENVQHVNHLIYSSTKFKATEKQFYIAVPLKIELLYGDHTLNCFIYPQITSIIDIVQQNGY